MTPMMQVKVRVRALKNGGSAATLTCLTSFFCVGSDLP